ncbi:MAG TPA: tRNA (N6-isopentenyl adenosine(37)-C2)-methylthiotransferase MiaB [Vicinamibacterales bacterium]|nr:tRNA (N6-isopentenyl adenosine(37)-C2)-methylthiotransferase MiaB [Vicinamibacterales bacterium]
MARKYLIETFGCQMNVHDSERMAGLLDQAGYEATTEDVDADVIVINTCSVREHAEEKLYTRLGELRVLQQETGRNPIVAVAGCVAQQEGNSLLSNTNGKVIDVVLGTQRLKMLPLLIDGAARSPFPVVDINPLDDVSFPLGVARRLDPVRAYVTIIEGCNDHCAFCVVPHTRGHERMRAKADILADVQEAVASGRREVQLLGQIVNHYSAPDDPSCDFPQLLADVDAIPGIERIRFASPHPRHTGTRLIEAVRDLPHVCKHLHLPVQSGSTRVLRAMRRRHTREDYLDLVQRIRETIPGVTLSTDMIVGFPGETAADFDETLSLTAAAHYHSMFSFKYSPRPNTLASKRMPDDVSPEEKTARIVALQDLQRSIQTRLHEQAVGTEVQVLVDSVSRRRERELSGRTSGNTVVNLPVPSDTSGNDVAADWIGRTVTVRITRSGPHSLSGEAVSWATQRMETGSC